MSKFNQQFTNIKSYINKDFLGVDETTFIAKQDVEFGLFKLFNTVQNRYVILERPVMHQVCYNNEDNWWQESMCFMAPKIISTMVDGELVNSIEMESYISNNEWVPELKSILKFDTILSKLLLLESKATILNEKIYKSGNDYIARADMIDKHLCNCLDTMNAIGNVYLHSAKGLLFEPAYTTTNVLIHIGLVSTGELGLLSSYTNYLENFYYQLNSFINTTLATSTPEMKNMLTIEFLTYDALQYNNTPKFSKYEFESKCSKFVQDINKWITDKISLIDKCLDTLESFDNILKIVSTVAIAINVSKKANNLQANIQQAFDQDTITYDREITIATNYAMDYKSEYPPQQIGEAITLAIRKSLNAFGYFNKFESLLDLVYEGIPQYDKINS